MKSCCTCRRELPSGSFGQSKRNPDGLSYKCKECSRAYVKAHYEAHKADYSAKARRWEAAQRAVIRDAKSRPCADCGGTFHFAAMDFDHVLGTAKAFTVSGGHKRGAASVLAEIAKCEVVCANCHRLRTFKRRAA